MAPAGVARAGRHLATARARRNWLNPLEALERGFALFQSTFAREAWRYYVGAAPLAVCFIPMWVADGQIRVSNSALLMEAAALAAAYLLRVWMVESYMQRIRERAFGLPVAKRAGAAAQTAALGRLLAWKITLSAAALATGPTLAGATWFYGACEFASLEAPDDGTEKAFVWRLPGAIQPVVRGRATFISDSYSTLDRRVVERPDPGRTSPGAYAPTLFDF